MNTIGAILKNVPALPSFDVLKHGSWFELVISWLWTGPEQELHYIAKSIGSPLLMNRFDYFSNFYEYKS